MDIKLDQHKVTFRNSFTKTTIQISFDDSAVSVPRVAA